MCSHECESILYFYVNRTIIFVYYFSMSIERKIFQNNRQMNCEMPYAEVPPLFQMYDEESHAEFEIPAGIFYLIFAKQMDDFVTVGSKIVHLFQNNRQKILRRT